MFNEACMEFDNITKKNALTLTSLHHTQEPVSPLSCAGARQRKYQLTPRSSLEIPRRKFCRIMFKKMDAVQLGTQVALLCSWTKEN